MAADSNQLQAHGSAGQPSAKDAATTKRALESEERYQAFVQNSHEGIWLVEVDKPIPTVLSPARQISLMYDRAYMAEANHAMAAMYGASSPDQLIGLRLSDLLVRSDPRNTAYLKAFIASGYALSGFNSHEVDMYGNEKVFRNSLVGVVKDGQLLRAWGTQQDITVQYQAERALRESQEHLSLALNASQMGTWEWNIQTNQLIWSDKLKALFGLRPPDAVTFETYMRIVHPKDRSLVKRTIQTAMKNGKEYHMEHRVVWPDGSVHWILGQGKALLENGKAVRMIGTSMNIDGLKRVEELKTVNATLKLQQEQLLALNRSKDEFISLASHQLRTPATVVKQYLGMLLQGFAGPVDQSQQKLLNVAFASNERQLAIINDLLKVAQIDAGRVVLNKTRVNLGKLLEAVVQEQQSSFRLHGQTLAYQPPVAATYAAVDAPRLRMALENIIENACKYSPGSSVTTVSLAGDVRQLTITVADQGVGIAKKDLRLLFQKFSRINNRLSTMVGGTGLGLYWAMKIIDLHGGSITVTSALRKGSTFVVTLPRRTGK